MLLIHAILYLSLIRDYITLNTLFSLLEQQRRRRRRNFAEQI